MSWEQIANAITFRAFYAASKVGKTGLVDVTVDVYRNDALIVTAAAASEVGGGAYKYELGSGSVTAVGEYLAVFKTADATVDQKWIPALWIVGRAGVEFLDASIAARTAGLVQRSEPPTVGAVADQVWDEALADHVTALSAGKKLTDLTAGLVQRSEPPTVGAVADQVWDEALAGHAGAGSAGAVLSAAGGVSDPLLNEVPGAYAQGTAGHALGRIGRAKIETNSPVSTSGILELTRGDDYSEEDGRALSFLSSSWPDLTGVTEVRLTVRKRIEAFRAGVTDDSWFTVTDVITSRVLGAGAQTIVFELTPTETGELEIAQGAERYAGKYDVQATLDGRIITLAVGVVKVIEDQTR